MAQISTGCWLPPPCAPPCPPVFLPPLPPPPPLPLPPPPPPPPPPPEDPFPERLSILPVSKPTPIMLLSAETVRGIFNS
ncbi:MAG: hypothetical protein GQ559_01610 [Desulfobulbaceae bacterium]|nr:hypothetical protein [Desulfobulbaceae bacterium]